MGKINKNTKSESSKLLGKHAEPSNVSTNLLPKKDKNKLVNKTITAIKATSKKEKYRQKRKNLMNKFALIRKQQKEERARRNREKTAVIGDLKPLKDALPSLDEIFKLSKEKGDLNTGVQEFDDLDEKQSTKKLSAKAKIKQTQQKFIRKVNSYQALLKDPDFKKNPREAIRYHIQYTHSLIDN